MDANYGLVNTTGHVFDVENDVNITNCPNCSNSTSEVIPDDNTLKTITTILLTVVLIVIMFAVGCHIELKELLVHLRRPFGIAIGFLAQFIVLPLAAFAMGHALQLPPLQALGMLVMSCCPGGPMSNMYSYWADGDVPLSVSMTTVNTALASGMMPLNLWLYGRSWSQTQAVIPYRTIGEGFAMVLLPAASGIFVRWKWPKAGDFVIKVGSVVAAVSVILTDTLMIVLYPYMFNVSWKIYVAVIFLPALSFLLGYLFSWIVRLTPQRRRTVALETAFQNFPLCVTLLALSYPKDQLGQIAVYPLLYGVIIIVEASVYAVICRASWFIRQRMGKDKESDWKRHDLKNEKEELDKAVKRDGEHGDAGTFALTGFSEKEQSGINI